MLSVSKNSLGAFVAGCLMATASAKQSTFEVADLVCAPQTAAADKFMSATTLDLEIVQTLNAYMCSEICPCPVDATQIYGNLSNSDQTLFNRSEMTMSESEFTFTTF